MSPVPDRLETILIVGFDGYIRFASADFGHFVGYSTHEVIGLPFNHFAAEAVRGKLTREWLALAEQPALQNGHPYRFDTLATTRTGEIFPATVQLTIISERDEYLVTVLSERPSLEQIQLKAFQTVAGAIGKKNIEEVLELILIEMNKLLVCDCVAIIVLDDNAERYWVRQIMNGVLLQTDDYPVTEVMNTTTTRKIQQTQSYLLIKDTLLDPDWQVLTDMPIRSWLGIPLIYQGQFLGLVDINSSKPHAFSEADAYLATTFATQATVALYNARAYEELHKRTERLYAMNDVALAVGRLDVEGVLEVVYQEVSKLMDTSSFYIGLYDKNTRELHLKQVYDQGTRMPDFSQIIDESNSMAAWAMSHRAPIILGDSERDPSPATSIYGGDTRSLILLPLMVQSEAVGVISVQSYEPDKFTPQDVSLLEAIAGPTAIAIRNATLYADIQRSLDEASALYELARLVVTNENLQEMMQHTVDELRGIFNAQACTIILREGEYISIVAVSGIDSQYVAQGRWTMEDEHVLAVGIIKSGTALYVADTHDDPDFRYLDPNLRSVLAVPLVTKDKVLGTLSLDSSRPNYFTREHERFLSIAAAQIAATLENRRLVSELREHAQELENAYKKLQSIDEVRQEIVTNVAHDLRAPLSFITGYVGLILEGSLGEIAPEQASALDVINRKVQSIVRLVGDIIAMERIRPENLRRQEVDLHALVREAVAGASIAYDKQGINLSVKTPEEPCFMRIDLDRINQVLDNLINNAVKYSKPGDFINVTSEIIENGRFAKISVQDEGAGIPPDKLKRIFERYVQVAGHTATEQGLGLGLAIVQQIIMAHGGSVDVQSEVGKGSVFFFTLPL